MNVGGFPTLDKTLEGLEVDASTPDIERRRREGNLKTVRAISAFEGVQPSKFARRAGCSLRKRRHFVRRDVRSGRPALDPLMYA